jgi:hypothetical protein
MARISDKSLHPFEKFFIDCSGKWRTPCDANLYKLVAHQIAPKWNGKNPSGNSRRLQPWKRELFEESKGVRSAVHISTVGTSNFFHQAMVLSEGEILRLMGVPAPNVVARLRVADAARSRRKTYRTNDRQTSRHRPP